MSDHYPASEDIEAEYIATDDIFEDEFIQRDAVLKGFLDVDDQGKGYRRLGEFDKSFGRNKYTPSDQDFTFFRPIPAEQSLHSLRVVRVEVYDEDLDEVNTLEVDPNDSSHFLRALQRLDYDENIAPPQKRGVAGALKEFSKFGSTSEVTLHFRKYMDVVLKENNLSPAFLQTPSANNIKEQVLEKTPASEIRSKIFKMEYPHFYEKFREHFVAINNYKLTLTAVEKNREYSPITKQPFDSVVKTGFTWNKLNEMALDSAREAFIRTKGYYQNRRMLMKHEVVIMSATSKLERELRDIKKGKEYDVSFLGSFLKQSGMKFNASIKGETGKQAIRRFHQEYQAFAGKKLDELESRGLQMILAIGEAKRRGRDTVGKSDMARAAQTIQEARKKPGEYISAKRLIDKVTGQDSPLTKSLLMMLDGRRTFARNVDKVRKLGQTYSRLSRGDSRVKKDDREEGKRFAATTFLRSLDKRETVAQAMLQELKRVSNGAVFAAKASSGLSDLSKRLLNQLTHPMTRNEAYRAAKVGAGIEQARPAGLSNDQGIAPGQGPEGDQPGRKPRR